MIRGQQNLTVREAARQSNHERRLAKRFDPNYF
jgi:hypothetical protein